MAQSKLDLINSMLATIGMDALTANDTQHPSYKSAERVLNHLDTEWQGKGWWFNTTTPILIPTVDDEIVYASDVLHIDPLDTNKNYVQRGLKLYDMDNETSTITESVECWVVRLKPIEELPPVAIAYLRAIARFEFFLDADGSMPKLGRYEQALGIAWNFLQVEHLKAADTNFFKGGHGLWFRQGYHSNQMNRAVARQPT